MNVQRFTGRNNKLALEQVRIVMGPEALILSNKRTADGVEICAMLETGSVIRPSIKLVLPLTPRETAPTRLHWRT
mgnify:CR=1 FL=1